MRVAIQAQGALQGQAVQRFAQAAEQGQPSLQREGAEGREFFAAEAAEQDRLFDHAAAAGGFDQVQPQDVRQALVAQHQVERRVRRIQGTHGFPGVEHRCQGVEAIRHISTKIKTEALI